MKRVVAKVSFYGARSELRIKHPCSYFVTDCSGKYVPALVPKSEKTESMR